MGLYLSRAEKMIWYKWQLTCFVLLLGFRLAAISGTALLPVAVKFTDVPISSAGHTSGRSAGLAMFTSFLSRTSSCFKTVNWDWNIKEQNDKWETIPWVWAVANNISNENERSCACRQQNWMQNHSDQENCIKSMVFSAVMPCSFFRYCFRGFCCPKRLGRSRRFLWPRIATYQITWYHIPLGCILDMNKRT